MNTLDVRVAIVSLDDAPLARSYLKESGIDWPLVLDPDRTLYRSYSLGDATMWQLANPVALAKHVRLMLRGRKPGRPGKNVWQLGGDVLIDPDRIVRMHVRSAEPHDRPTVESILSVVRESSTDS